jgi:arginase
VDGHLDYYDGASAPIGALADMELGILTGHGPRALTAIVGEPPLVHATDAWVLGYRDHSVMLELGAADAHVELPDAHFVDDAGVRRHGPREVGRIAADALAERPGRFWLHVDVDVLSPAAMPAVDDIVPGGLSWDELTALVRPLAQSDSLLGIDVAIYNPSLDPERRLAPRIVQLLADVLRTDEPS